jgi:glutaredoxin 3
VAAVTLYTSNYCGYCRRAVSLLQSKGVAFDEISVDGHPDRRREMERLSGRHTVPQIWIGERHVGGCDDLFALERSGQLDPLLAA